MNAEVRIRILCVDDHPLFRMGIAAVLGSQPDILLVALGATGEEGILLADQLSPDVTLMDLRLPDMSGIAALRRIRLRKPEARVIVLTTFEGDAEVQRALSAGARAYVLKSGSPDELLKVIRSVYVGHHYIPAALASDLAQRQAQQLLTAREIDVIALVAGGNRNRDIAERLGLSEDTVKGYLKNIMDKLEAKDRTEAVTIAIRRGIIHL